MPYSRRHCRHCGRPTEQAGAISSSGSCAGCAIARTIASSRAMLDQVPGLVEAAIERERARDRARYRRERATD